MMTGHGITEVQELEEMSTEQFLAWMLSSCEIAEEYLPVIRRDVQGFMLARLVEECFSIVEVEKGYPNLHAWLEMSAPGGSHGTD